jgi:hypothetical protein
MQRRLRAALYRFDCPPPESIGEYALEFLVDPERREIAEHLLGCAECAEELLTLREFLATNPAMPGPARLGTWGRMFATLFTPNPRLTPSLTRGEDRGTSVEYQSGPIRIIVGTVAAPRHGSVAVDGLILHEAAAPDVVAGCHVALLACDAPVHTTRTDDLGNFTFESVATGTYALEIHVAEEVVVIEDLDLGGKS